MACCLGLHCRCRNDYRRRVWEVSLIVFKVKDLNFGAGPIDRVLWPTKDHNRLNVQVRHGENKQ
jgi:hypothetical protein